MYSLLNVSLVHLKLFAASHIGSKMQGLKWPFIFNKVFVTKKNLGKKTGKKDRRKLCNVLFCCIILLDLHPTFNKDDNILKSYNTYILYLYYEGYKGNFS